MTDQHLPNLPPEPENAETDPMAALLQRALARPPEPQIRFLPGVQERIRLRSRGRHFAARRTAYRDPIMLLLLAASIILLVGAVVFLVFEALDRTQQHDEGQIQLQKSTDSSKK